MFTEICHVTSRLQTLKIVAGYVGLGSTLHNTNEHMKEHIFGLRKKI